ncbi:hypothetical protein ACJMK2_033487 [Sinanodonta woodiana]|uniref:Lipase n=1 Tax=Sinanodonta woodiana TaxID=1069815 RepID=A0ABD3WQC7_SINWO
MSTSLMNVIASIFIVLSVVHTSNLFKIENEDARFGNSEVDPEVSMNATQLITSKGYPCENHYVTTEDGFILNLQRIPHGKKNTVTGKTTKPVVLVQHGLLASSTCFLENLANESLGFILADAGMDVWLGNSRGNFYSRKHKTLKPSDKEFWAWSWDEMAKYDMPANIQYILGLTGAKQLTYIGHSQGTEMAFGRLSEDAELNKMINLFVALAPVANLGDIKGPVKVFAPYTKEIEAFFDALGIYEFLPDTKVNQWLAKNFCDKEIPEFLCENILFLLCGFDYKETNMSRVPVYVGHNPAGTSVQNMLHYAQSVNSGLFQKFDYGSAEENMRHYNQTTPPVYDVRNIETPMALFTGPEDWLADPTDVSKLRPLLKNVIYEKDIPGWNHLDFIWGMNAPQECYKDIISLIKRIQQ